MHFGEDCNQPLLVLIKRTLKPDIDERFRVSGDQESREAFSVGPLIEKIG
jgi:hypothetical protein